MPTIIPGVVSNGVVVPESVLPEGAHVDVVLLPNAKDKNRVSILDLIASLPPGPHAFKTWAEYEEHRREEKKAWER